jgi:hypothetical protein
MGLACLALTHIHFVWFHYFYSGWKVGVEPKMMELYYKEALQRQEQQSCQTLVKSEYQNYCALVNGFCSKLIEQQGPRSSFFAYPFVEDSKQRMTALKKELEARHHVIVMPTHNTFAEVLVCKLCKEILSSRYIVIEAWIPNRNVFFEYGMAMGFGKRSWLLSRSQSNGNWMKSYSVLADTRHIPSDELTAMQVADCIARDSTFDTIPTPLAIKKDLKAKDTPSATCFLFRTSVLFGPDELDLQLQGVDKKYQCMIDILETHLRAYGFKAACEVSRRGSHKQVSFLRLVDSASAVCGLLVADTVNKHEEINSIVSLLLGYALAKGKKILVFQHTPCSKPMINLRGVVESVNGPKHLAKICPTMIDKYLARRDPKFIRI